MPLPDSTKSFTRAAELARWSSGTKQQASILEYLSKGHKANDAFLSKLAGAEQRDEVKRDEEKRKPVVGPAGQDTQREIDEAREAALRAREVAAGKLTRQRRPSIKEIEAASELFWAHDSDANATIDKDEWAALIEDVARRTGRRPFTPAEAQAAFERADVDGNGSLDLREWLQASFDPEMVSHPAEATVIAATASAGSKVANAPPQPRTKGSGHSASGVEPASELHEILARSRQRLAQAGKGPRPEPSSPPPASEPSVFAMAGCTTSHAHQPSRASGGPRGSSMTPAARAAALEAERGESSSDDEGGPPDQPVDSEAKRVGWMDSFKRLVSGSASTSCVHMHMACVHMHRACVHMHMACVPMHMACAHVHGHA